MGRIVGSVAHDFNNLLTGILLYCDLLRSGLERGSVLRGYVEEIRRAGGHSSELIQQLLAVARTPTGSVAESWLEVVEGMQHLISRMLGENIALHVELASDLGMVKLDPTQMRQILMNLLLNARDAMPAGGRVSVIARNSPRNGPASPAQEQALRNWVELEVADNGCGMDAETCAHIFDPFFTTKPGKGTGLGLDTVHRIVSQANGTVRAESEPGQGTRLIVRLPRADAPRVRPESDRPESEPQPKHSPGGISK